MSISPGTRLGPYEVVSPIGSGGMGEVFKARDTRLDRSVAIKILPAELVNDARLKLRFEREAKTISQLNHPNICTVYDVGDNYFVMELLEGESLADRIARGPLPIDQVLRYGMQIAEALERAHDAGVVHRDLKPGNVMLTKSGAKLLDFGLAKSGGYVHAGQGDLTEQKPLTEEGAIVGTLQYMAPEQIEGKEADARTDLFAFGEILYEMATGKRAFAGKTRTSLIASIVAAQPQPIATLQPVAPRGLDAIVTRCLEKEPGDRWQCAADLRWELARVDGERAGPSQERRSRNSALAWTIAAAAVIAAAVAAFFAARPRTVAAPVTKFNFDVPRGWISATELKSGPPVVSPDGRTIAFVATDASSGRRAIWLRRIDDDEVRMLPGTDDGSHPFWSPDGRSLAFFGDNNNRLKRIDIAGGPAQVICESQNGRGGSWSSDGTIVFAPSPTGPLLRVSAGGGNPLPVTRLDEKQRETTHRWPSFLPDGKHFFYIARRLIAEQQSFARDRIMIGNLDGGDPKFVLEANSNIHYTDPGYVLYARDRALFAQKFDLTRLELAGEAIPIVSRLQYHASGFGMFSADASTLLYQAGSVDAQLEILDRASGRITPLMSNADQYSLARFSYDGQSIVYDLGDPGSGYQDVWLFDRDRKISRRLTTSPADDFSGVLSPDGTRVYFTSNRTGSPLIYWKPLDGGPETLVHQGRQAEFAQSISPDGRFLAYVELGPSQNDIGVISLADGRATPFCNSQFDEVQPQFSPDGRHVAFSTNESGRYEVYVAPFPAGTPRTQISIDGGSQPTWRRDGRELYYIGTAGRLTAVPIETAGRVKAGAPSVIATVALRPSRNTMREYDVSADGKTFLLNSTGSGPRSVPFTVVLNWTEALKQ